MGQRVKISRRVASAPTLVFGEKEKGGVMFDSLGWLARVGRGHREIEPALPCLTARRAGLAMYRGGASGRSQAGAGRSHGGREMAGSGRERARDPSLSRCV